MSRPMYTWLKYGSRIKDDVRMKKLESVDSKGFIHYLDLILLVTLVSHMIFRRQNGLQPL